MEKESLPQLNVEDIRRAAGAVMTPGHREGKFLGVSTDSRHITKGNLFVALVGERFDGHDFLKTAVAAGASGVVIQRDRKEKVNSLPADVTVLRVEDTLKALGDIARYWRMKFKVPVVAITGSSGKTTTKEMVATVLGQTKTVLKNEGNLNNLIGLPLTLFKLHDRHEAVVLEMGTNRRGEIRRLTEIAEPDIGIITNVGTAHLEGLKSLEMIREEKGDLFNTMAGRGVAIINSDDPNLSPWEERWSGQKITFGIRRAADVYAEHITHEGEKGTIFTLWTGKASREITVATIGNHNVYNALAAAAAARACHIPFDKICRGLMSFRPVSGRMEVHRLKNGAFLINDAYNANPASVGEALKTLRELKGESRSVVVLGDMLELGDQSEKLHEDIGRMIGETGVGKAFLRGQFARAVAQGAMKKGLRGDQIHLDLSPEEITESLRRGLRVGDWVLVKGSHRMRMEEVVQEIVRKIGLEN
ncbi:MAG: UDP-N-acetylmuramoyl-tripeptide--D-alanyl-D-alanine ligase [Deltaproteobacteria bacterium]|nr:UDP-N-acetylmuramoyl-tripeptide--D-alanyl-D-alanine ligase [Deltaproteobacteria bacterium]